MACQLRFSIYWIYENNTRELDEAMLDGCSHLCCYSNYNTIIKTSYFYTFILNFIGSWNDIQVPYFSKSDKWALPLTVYNFMGHSSSWNLIFADVIITVFPLLLLYVCTEVYNIRYDGGGKS